MLLVERTFTDNKRNKAQYLPVPPGNLPNDSVKLLYRFALTNEGSQAVYNLVLDNPIPEGLVYVLGSASGDDAEVQCSCDGGVSFHSEDEQLAAEHNCDSIRWKVRELAPGRSAMFSLKLVVSEF